MQMISKSAGRTRAVVRTSMGNKNLTVRPDNSYRLIGVSTVGVVGPRFI